MKKLLIVTAVLEAGTGLALMVSPPFVVWLLLATSFEMPAALIVGRLAGAALFSLGVVCWIARKEQSPAAIGLVLGVTFYNAFAAAILAYAGIGLQLSGIGLWPAVLIHAALLGWCIVSLRGKEIKPVR